MTTETPKRIGRYEVVRRVGAGGEGEVLLARDPHLDRAVTLKRVGAGLDPALVLAGARAVATLPHPNLGRVLDVLEDGSWWLVSDWVEGETVLERLRTQGSILAADAAAIALDVARALAHLHAHKVVHRDVKPSNVVIEPHGRAVLIDCGLARRVGTALEASSGTAGYMPVEGTGTPAADVYALGATLYELLTGVNPHEQEWVEGAPRRPRDEGIAESTEALDQLVLDCLALKAPARPSAEQVVARLGGDRPPAKGGPVKRETRRPRRELRADELTLDAIRQLVAERTTRSLARFEQVGRHVAECYLTRPALHAEVAKFLAPHPTARPDRSGGLYPNTLLVTGPAGSGKSAFLARTVADLLREGNDGCIPVLLRANAYVERRDLLDDLHEALGLKRGELSSTEALLDHVASLVPEEGDVRLVLLVDAVDEAREAASTVFPSLVELVAAAGCQPWCRVVATVRTEFLASRSTAFFTNSRPYLYPRQEVRRGSNTGGRLEKTPGLTLEVLDPVTASTIYEGYRDARRAGVDVSACETPWGELDATTRELLARPLLIRIFMERFDGRAAAPIATEAELLDSLVEHVAGTSMWFDAAWRRFVELMLAARSSVVEWPRLEEDRSVSVLREEGFLEVVSASGSAARYRFVYPKVAEFLLYRYARESRADGADERAHWVALAAASKGDGGFPEETTRFIFLFDELATASRFEDLIAVAEAAAPAVQQVLQGYLVEIGRVPAPSGSMSAKVASVAAALARSASRPVAEVLASAARTLEPTDHALSALVYWETVAALLGASKDNEPAARLLLGEALVHGGSLRHGLEGQASGETPLREALEMFRELAGADPGTSADAKVGEAVALVRLASTVRHRADRPGEATELLAQASAILESVPGGPDVQVYLADALTAQARALNVCGDTAAARQGLERAIATLEALIGLRPERTDAQAALAHALQELGVLHDDTGAVELAREVFERERAVLAELCARTDARPAWRQSLARAMRYLGKVLGRLGHHERAESLIRESIALLARLREQVPKDLEVHNHLARATMAYGNYLARRARPGDVAAALRELVAAEKLGRKLRDRAPDRSAYRTNHALQLRELGRHLGAQDQREKAGPLLDEAVGLLSDLQAEQPANRERVSSLSAALLERGVLAGELGRSDVARADFGRAEQLLRPIVLAHPERVAWAHNHARALVHLTGSATNASDQRAGERRARDAITTLARIKAHHATWSDPVLEATARCELARCLAAGGAEAEADREFELAIETLEARVGEGAPASEAALALARARRLRAEHLESGDGRTESSGDNVS